MRLNRGRPLLLITLLIGTRVRIERRLRRRRRNSSGPARPAVATTTAADVGSPAPDVPEALRFRAPLVGGGEIDMSTLAGKPVVLWFWAPY